MAQQKVFGITIGKPDKKVATDGDIENIPMPTTDWEFRIPTINVIPKSILEGYKSKTLLHRFITIGVMIAVVFIGLFAYSFFGDIGHKNSLASIESESDRVTSQITSLQPYKEYKISVSEKLTVLASYLSTDVDVSKLLNIMYENATDNGIVFNDLTVTISDTASGDNASGCVQSDPFNKDTSIGCVTFSGSQPDSDSLNGFFEKLQNQEGFVNIFLENASYGTGDESGESENSFSGMIAFTDLFYSDKYTNLTLDIDTIIEGGGLDNAAKIAAEAAAEAEKAAVAETEKATDAKTGGN